LHATSVESHVQLHQVIRARRQAAGLTQRQLADAAGISLGVLRELEQGVTARPKALTLRCLSEVLGDIARLDNGSGHDHPTGILRIQALGPLAAWRGSAPLALGTGHSRTVLGLLAIHAGAMVSREAISEALWGDNPPRTAAGVIQSCVMRLRRTLDPGRPAGGVDRMLITAGTSYRLQPANDGLDLDLRTYERLSRQARVAWRAREAFQASELFDQALGLWQGDPLADVEPLKTHPAVARLALERAGLVVEYAEAASAHGWHSKVLPHLQALAGHDQLNEHAHACLMIALAGGGHQAAALEVYEQIRRRLDDQLGVRPGADLAAAHARVLRQDIPAAAPDTGIEKITTTAPHAGRGPAGLDTSQAQPDARPVLAVCQLPPCVADFTGRTAQVAELLTMLTGSGGHDGPGDAAVPVVVISGLPGAGKTALAVHVAHRVRPCFPDGQLWVSLAGASLRPRDPGEVAGEFLRALGVPGSALPAGTAERAALLRSRLADRKVLVVADDAASAAQVQPLLPGTSGSAVIITSRTPLAAPGGALLLPLDPFTPAEAAELLGRIVGRARATAEPEAAAQLATACGLLPLGIRITGARLAARPSWPISVLAERVADEKRRLDELQIGDLSVRASLAPSYHCLGERAQRAFRFLALLGPADVAEWVIAALLGEPAASNAVNELVDKSLITLTGTDPTGQPRYRLHDLLRDYAAELLAHDGGRELEAAQERLLASWLQLASIAGARLPSEPYFPASGTDPAEGPVPEPLAARLTIHPVAWFDAERLNLLAAAERASAAGKYRDAAQLATFQATYHYLHSRHEDAERIWHVVFKAATSARDHVAAARAELRIAAVACCRGKHAEAAPAVDRCVAALEEAADQRALSTALYWRSVCFTNLGFFAEAVIEARRALVIAQQLEDRHAELMALRMIGMAEASTPGGQDGGAATCMRALSIARSTREPIYERETLHTVAHVLNSARRHDESISLCRRGMELDRELEYPVGQGPWLGVLGDAYQGLGRYQEATTVLSHARSIFEAYSMRRHQALCLLKLSYAHQGMADYHQALSFLEDSLPIFQELRLSHYQERVRHVMERCRAQQPYVPPASVPAVRQSAQSAP
jgi:DNA-binding SARP family transcriptional activator/tetratricopeptide (TPR) repeat protein